jgi:starvation-inducible DNA-binding protein
MAARMDKEEDGSSFVRLQIAVTDPVAAQKIADKRYMTGSVGGRAGKAVCSISGEDLAAEDDNGKPRVARYKRGKVYKGKMAFVDMQDISFKEYSFVNQPADQRSGVRGSKTTDGSAPVADSDNWVAKSAAFVLHMDNEDIVSINENESILKNMKKKESKPVYLHLKGAFLTALAIQENENVNNQSVSLLSNEDSIENKSEENLKMKDVATDDILAVTEELSEDLSIITAGGSKEEPAEEAAAPTEEVTPVEEAAPVAEEPVAEETAPEEVAPITEAEAMPVAEALQKVLNDTVVFYYAAHRAHWNVEGEDFTEFHELFSNIYEDALGSLDPIAENMRKLQAFPATLTESVMNASFKDDATVTEAMGLASTILEKNNVVNASVMAAFAAANAANEQGIANFLAERDDMHKKWAWQLRSSLKMEAEDAAESAWREENRSTEATEEAEERNQEVVVDSANTEATEENKDTEVTEAELTGVEVAVEQKADDSDNKLQALEEENQKLRSALHRTLAERVVDAKIAVGIESYDAREELIVDHVKRNAASLADSLRDLAKMPNAKSVKASMPEINPEIETVENDDNVITIDVETKEEEVAINPAEQLFVDALMGRRKL